MRTLKMNACIHLSRSQRLLIALCTLSSVRVAYRRPVINLSTVRFKGCAQLHTLQPAYSALHASKGGLVALTLNGQVQVKYQ